MKGISSFFRIIDLQTLIVTFLAIVSTFICNRFQFYANLPSGLIGIAIIFPIVFSINSAYRRREEVLRYFASLKAHAAAILYAHRDWAPEKNDHFIRSEALNKNLFDSIRKYFSSPVNNETDRLNAVYRSFSNYSLSHEALRNAKVPANEISRVNQYLRAMIIEFEKMRNILKYRTPTSLRAYSQVFLNIFPILFGPYFAKLCHDSYAVIGYGVAVLYSVVLVSLDNIQEELENPYDGIGADDIHLDDNVHFELLFKSEHQEV
jgi:hypothetical protein